MRSGDRAWGEAIQPLDVQTGSSCAALLGIGRPLGLRTDTSRDWSDSLQIPGTQQPVALIVTGDTQSCHGKEQKTGRQAGILQHGLGHGCYHFLNMEENLIWGRRGVDYSRPTSPPAAPRAALSLEPQGTAGLCCQHMGIGSTSAATGGTGVPKAEAQHLSFDSSS